MTDEGIVYIDANNFIEFVSSGPYSGYVDRSYNPVEETIGVESDAISYFFDINHFFNNEIDKAIVLEYLIKIGAGK